MIIKKIKLENIRSYENSEVNFPLGSTLLSGDIGSGKSSVLLALEFAFFGLQTGILSGQNLLRKGADSGSVELELEVNGKVVKIKRNLERKKTSVGQGKDCSLEIDGSLQKLSPEDLKAKVLEILNYPQSMLKSKTNLLYRFTIYTPQEEMKQILLEKPEERINTLRKIFGIDKYKNIISNIDIVSGKIKENIKIKESKIDDLDTKKQDKKNLEIQKDNEEIQLKNIMPLIEVMAFDIIKNKKTLQEFSLKIKKAHELKTEIISTKIGIKNSDEQKNRNMKEIERIDKSLQETFDMSFKSQDFKKEMITLKNDADEKDKRIREFFSEIAVNESKKRDVNELEKRIHDLVECPYCKQVVSQEHKTRILEEAKKNIDNCDKRIAECRAEREKFELESKNIKDNIEKLRDKEKEAETVKLKLKWIADQKKIRDSLFDETKALIEKQFSLEEKLKVIEQEAKEYENVEKNYEEQEEIIENLTRKERDLAIKKAQHERQIQYYDLRIKEIEKEIKMKEGFLVEISRLKKLNEWISEHLFTLLMSIEKNVMLTINIEFNKMFEKWFSMLTENLNARINEDFSPIIEQQGYEIDYEALSGGERTAAALAYRLSLNQIINNLMSKLSTRGLLILDEPTDGFSTEQLEKMRNILDELKTEQLILVSHEAKIENFVQKIIRFEKIDGKSSIV